MYCYFHLVCNIRSYEFNLMRKSILCFVNNINRDGVVLPLDKEVYSGSKVGRIKVVSGERSETSAVLRRATVRYSGINRDWPYLQCVTLCRCIVHSTAVGCPLFFTHSRTINR